MAVTKGLDILVYVGADSNMNVTVERHDVHVKKGHISINLAKDQLGSIHLRMDKNNNKFYHAVMVFDIYIY